MPGVASSQACGRGCACGRGRGVCVHGRGLAHGRIKLEVVLLLLVDIQIMVFPTLRVFGKKRSPHLYITSTTLSAHIDRNSSPAQLFGRSFTDEVRGLLLEKTDMQILIVLPHMLVPEFKAFVGMFISMIIVILLWLELYWTTSHPLIGTSGIASVMP